MKKILFTLLILITSIDNLSAENVSKRIYEGKEDSKNSSAGTIARETY